MPPERKRLHINPEPLKIVKRPRCVRCRRFAPGCTCYRDPDYRWPDGTKA